MMTIMNKLKTSKVFVLFLLLNFLCVVIFVNKYVNNQTRSSSVDHEQRHHVMESHGDHLEVRKSVIQPRIDREELSQILRGMNTMPKAPPIVPIVPDVLKVTFDKTRGKTGIQNTKAQAPATGKSKNENLCLKLAPKKYIERKGRVFTAEELDIRQYNNTEPLIPKIIHQTWNTYDIPKPAAAYVKTILEKHPDWQYWFWTEKDRQCYMKTFHPDLLDLFNDYPHTIFRTNLMRYFMLYDYGGFYIDLDVECLKPLDIWTHIGSSILTHETYEHTFFAHLRNQPNVMNTVMATRPKHPYYKVIQGHLKEYHELCPKLNLYSNGPFYIDNMFQLYLKSNPNLTAHDDVTVIHPRYWLPTYAKSTDARIKSKCAKQSLWKDLPVHQRELCEVAQERHLENKPYPDSFLRHYWANSNVKGSYFLTEKSVSMFDIVPNLRKVSDILDLHCDE